MAKKISELPSTTTPPSTVEIAVVDSGTTKKTTAADLAPSLIGARLGWFDTGHNGADQTGLGTTETQLLVDNLDTNMGGYGYLPDGVVEADVYEAGTAGATSKIKLDWLEAGQMILVRVTGTATTSSANTAASTTIKFFDASDVEIFSLSDFAFFNKAASAVSFNDVFPVFISSALATTGAYCKLYMTFDTGASNSINMGGFTVAVIS